MSPIIIFAGVVLAAVMAMDALLGIPAGFSRSDKVRRKRGQRTFWMLLLSVAILLWFIMLATNGGMDATWEIVR